MGVLFTPNLKFREHINKITRKANSVVGIIKRSFTSCLDKVVSYPLCQFGSPTFGICLSDLEPTSNRRYTGLGKSSKACYKISSYQI